MDSIVFQENQSVTRGLRLSHSDGCSRSEAGAVDAAEKQSARSPSASSDSH